MTQEIIAASFFAIPVISFGLGLYLLWTKRK
jgi:hypothetical protein